jgi:protein-disulfide isomerase
LVDEVLKGYPDRVAHVFKQFPLTQIHPQAMGAAKASIAAQRQGKFWEYHDLLFANARALQPENLRKYAEQLGLNLEQFDRDVADPEVEKQVQTDMRLGGTAGVRGTPTIFVGGRRLQNRSVDGFKAMIDPLLRN